MSRSDLVDLEVNCLAWTDKAWLVESVDTGKTAWVARSIADVDKEPNRKRDLRNLTLPRWAAEDKELA